MDAPHDPTTLPDDLTIDDLPTWMRQAYRRFDWGVVLALLLGLVSVWPFLLRGGLPHGTGLELSAYRVAEMANAIQDGAIYPRWAPNLLYGYGLPLFNFAAPGATYPAAIFALTTENTPVDGVRFVIASGGLLSAWGMFAFVRRRWGPTAGLIAVASYSLSPTLACRLPFIDGDLALLFALHIQPLLFWAIDRALIYRRGRDVLLLGGFAAALLLADEQIAPLLFLPAVGWLTWLWLFERRTHLWLAGVGLFFGAGLSAFFWLPALLEYDQAYWVTISTGVEAAPLTLGGLLAPFAAVNHAVFNPTAGYSLGLITWLFALGGVLAVTLAAANRALTRRHRTWAYFALLFAAQLVIVISADLPWPPTGSLALLGMPLAITAAGMSHWLPRLTQPRRRQIAFLLLIGLPVLGAFPALHPPEWPADFGPTDVLARLQLELDEYSIATVPPGAALPLPSAAVFTPARPLIEGYTIDQIDRVNRQLFTSGRADVLNTSGGAARFLVLAPNPTHLPLYISAFPGWRATVDGESVPPERDENGLLRVPVLSGDHDVTVTFADTPARTGGWLLSGISLLALLTLALLRARQPSAALADREVSLLTLNQTRAAAAILIALTALLLVDISPAIRQPTTPTQIDGVAFRHYTRAGIDLLAYDVRQLAVTPGDTLPLTLYWRAVRPPADNLQITVSLADAAEGTRFAQSYKRHIGGYPTTRWPPEQYVRDHHRLTIPADTPPGAYILLVEAWECADTLTQCDLDQRLDFFGSRGASAGESLVLPVLVTVSPP